MTAVRAFGSLVKGASIAWKDVPEQRLSEFIDGLDGALNQRARMSAQFGVPEKTGPTMVAELALDEHHTLLVKKSDHTPQTGDDGIRHYLRSR